MTRSRFSYQPKLGFSAVKALQSPIYGPESYEKRERVKTEPSQLWLVEKTEAGQKRVEFFAKIPNGFLFRQRGTAVHSMSLMNAF